MVWYDYKRNCELATYRITLKYRNHLKRINKMNNVTPEEKQFREKTGFGLDKNR